MATMTNEDKATLLVNAQDGSLISYKGGICWKSDGLWYALRSKERAGAATGWGEQALWRTTVYEATDLELKRVEIVDLLF